jgi:hypothetical protein
MADTSGTGDSEPDVISMADRALTAATHGFLRAMLVLAVLIALAAIVAYFVADKLGRTPRARQGIFIGVASTGLVFAAMVAWTVLRSAG